MTLVNTLRARGVQHRRMDDSWSRAQALYPSLEHLADDGSLMPLRVSAGTVLFTENQPCIGFPLVLEGEVSVTRVSEDGRSLELYRIGPGELCLVSGACLFGGRQLAGRGTSVGATRLLVVPPATFDAWLAHPQFRAFVFNLFNERLADLAGLVDAIAFHRLDQRLAAALLGHGPVLAVTHQELAATLGTVREMVSRLLQRFERQGWITTSRERIEIVDSAALRDYSGAV